MNENRVPNLKSGYGFSVKESLIYDQLQKDQTNTYKIAGKNFLGISSGDSDSSDSEDERIFNKAWENYEKTKNSEVDEPELLPEMHKVSEKVEVDLLPGIENENDLETNYHSRLAGLWDTFQQIKLSEKEINYDNV